LRRIADGLKYTSWGRSNEDFSDNSILVGRDGGCSHLKQSPV